MLVVCMLLADVQLSGYSPETEDLSQKEQAGRVPTLWTESAHGCLVERRTQYVCIFYFVYVLCCNFILLT